MPYLLVFLSSFTTALLLTPLVKRLSLRWGVVAEPGGRRTHAGRIPKLGGLALFIAWLVGVGLTYWLLPPEMADDVTRLRGVVIGSLIVVIGGLWDDWFELKPIVQFMIQLAGTAVALSHLIFIELFTNPLPGSPIWTTPPFSWIFTLDENIVFILPPLALLFTLFWMVGMINAVN
ncbi:MAG: hypothetical protein KAG66_23165, partial [Methylococcales bacterium]|nr:hypothetical protein [Methylococcales bacterium]